MNQSTKATIWVLTDFRTGNAVQCIALAEALGLSYSVKKMEYNFLAKLPNFLLGNNCIYIKDTSKQSLETNTPPKIVISSGRRTAPIAAYIKRKYPDVKLVQIMRPSIDTNIFDLIILPQHDTFSNSSSRNIIRTIGSINNMATRLENYPDNFSSQYNSMKVFIGVLVGGDTKEYKYSRKDATELCKAIEHSISAHGIPAFISFSRRTPSHLKRLFYENFQQPHIIYDPTNSPGENPYLGILKSAKFLVITSDSVSMCSEAASSGKPLYIFSPKNFNSKKHKYFIQQLTDLNIARPYRTTTGLLDEYHYTPLNEVEKVSNLIRSTLLEYGVKES